MVEGCEIDDSQPILCAGVECVHGCDSGGHTSLESKFQDSGVANVLGGVCTYDGAHSLGGY